MATIYKKTDSPYWWISNGHLPGSRKRDRRKTPFRLTAYSKTQVQKIIDQSGADSFLSLLGITQNSGSLIQVLGDYCKEVDAKHGGKATIDYCKDIKNRATMFVDFIGGKKDVTKCTALDVETYLLNRLSNGIAISTVKKDKCFIKQFFDTAVASGMLPKDNNPVDSVRKSIIPQETKKNRKINREPIPSKYMDTVLSSNPTQPWDIPFWSLMYYTGADPGNASSMPIENIDLDEKLISFQRVKNGNPTEWIPLHKRLMTFDLVNIVPNPTKTVIRGSRQRFQKAMKKAGYGKRVDFKCLRHTFNQRLAESGIGEQHRAKLLGQNNIKTQRTYSHQDTEMLRNAMDGIS